MAGYYIALGSGDEHAVLVIRILRDLVAPRGARAAPVRTLFLASRMGADGRANGHARSPHCGSGVGHCRPPGLALEPLGPSGAEVDARFQKSVRYWLGLMRPGRYGHGDQPACVLSLAVGGRA